MTDKPNNQFQVYDELYGVSDEYYHERWKHKIIHISCPTPNENFFKQPATLKKEDWIESNFPDLTKVDRKLSKEETNKLLEGEDFDSSEERYGVENDS